MVKLQKIALGVSGVGMAATVANFFRTSGLAVQCQSADIVCNQRANDQWFLYEEIAIGIVAFGLVLFVLGFVQARRKPRP